MTARPYRGVFLTEKGQALADRVRVRHRLVVDVLCALGVPTESAEADAEGIEHHVSEITLKAFAQFLQGPGAEVGQRGLSLRRVGGQRVDDAVDDFLDQALSSPSPMTRMTGSVPDGLMTNRP